MVVGRGVQVQWSLRSSIIRFSTIIMRTVCGNGFSVTIWNLVKFLVKMIINEAVQFVCWFGFFPFFFSMEFEIKPLLFLGSNLYAYVFHKWSCLSFQEIAFFSSWFCFLFCGFCTWLTSTSLWSNGIEFESEPICLPWFMKRKRICLLLVKPSCCVHDLL